MTAVLKPDFLTVDDYLAGEEHSEIRHEYIDGQVFAMAGGSDVHNIISLNIAAALLAHLRGSPCRAFIGDVKTRLSVADRDQFYYPDIMVVCDPRDTDSYYKRFPKVVIEVLSETTERIDRTEKFWSYTQIETLEEYVLVAQEKSEVTLFRRANRWQPEVLVERESALRLPSLDFSLPLSAIYEGVKPV